ncbi:MAG TPA: M56 family metallopeptidase [Bryobacteraceae bacterium]|nr:M56 family metallopeptidase [Bryobacteraceae bacterium]
MIASYAVRLACLSLTVFLLVHTLAGALVAAAVPAAIRAAGRMRPRGATRLLLSLRMFPAAAASLVVGVFCVPSYLWLEPESGAEEMGWLCLGAAALAAVMFAASLLNAVRAFLRSRKYTRHCERTGAPVLMLTGILRPRLVVSRAVRDALSPEQLAAAIGHEYAHLRASDNFKRLLLAATPRLPGFRALERAWSRTSEWAADDEAVAGDTERSLCLASALVRVARLGTVPAEVGFLGDGADLACRIERLLHPRAHVQPRRKSLVPAAALALTASFVVFVWQARTLESAHRLFEHLVH